MAKLMDLTGERFERLTVVGRAPARRGRSEAYWLCQCECGGRTQAKGRDLRIGVTRSCGCLLREKGNKARIKHGMCGTSEYQTWRNIRNRCASERSVNFEYYGGRGIRVCLRWVMSFEDFLADMGKKPSPSHTIERIDNDGDYEPGNCRWASMAEQQLNKRPFRSVRTGKLP